MALVIIITIIATILFYTIIMPILDTISSYIQSFINKKIHSWQLEMSIKEAETQAKVEEISGNSSTITQAIGFEIPTTPDESEIYCHGKR